jgi:hypothetical protein
MLGTKTRPAQSSAARSHGTIEHPLRNRRRTGRRLLGACARLRLYTCLLSQYYQAFTGQPRGRLFLAHINAMPIGTLKAWRWGGGSATGRGRLRGPAVRTASYELRDLRELARDLDAGSPDRKARAGESPPRRLRRAAADVTEA